MAKPLMGEFEDRVAYLVGRLCLLAGMVAGSTMSGAVLVGALLIGAGWVVRDLLILRRITPTASGEAHRG